jgi:hypothetical protein
VLARNRAKLEYFAAKYSDLWYFAALFVAVTINLIIFFGGSIHLSSSLACTSECDDHSVFHWVAQSWDTEGLRQAFGLQLEAKLALAVRVLSLLHVLLSGAMWIGWLSVPGRVFLDSVQSSNDAWHLVEVEDSRYKTEIPLENRQERSLGSSLLAYTKLLLNTAFVVHSLYFVTSLAGLTISPFFYGLELFALAYRVQLFHEIVSAIVNNPMRLVTTIVLGIIGLWTFVLLGVAFFQSTYSLGSDSSDWNDFCYDFRSCMAYHVQFGAGNAPDFTDDPAPQGQRLLFSFVYTFTLLWIIVATVSGTIIDNLGELRDQRSAISADLEQRCFICSINRSLFEDVSENGFTEHVTNQHNVWDYLRHVALRHLYARAVAVTPSWPFLYVYQFHAAS